MIHLEDFFFFIFLGGDKGTYVTLIYGPSSTSHHAAMALLKVMQIYIYFDPDSIRESCTELRNVVRSSGLV